MSVLLWRQRISFVEFIMVIFILSVCKWSSQESAACGQGEWSCRNNQCIEHTLLCNGEENCQDRSDEWNCTRCSDQAWTCSSGQCVPGSYRCDGRKDCPDNSDERNCSSCSKYSFHCDNESCLLDVRLCDRVFDCRDSSDETNCSPCPAGYWSCESGQCIKSGLRCDGELNCKDTSDEKDCDDCSGVIWRCNDGHCVQKSMKCDGIMDCRDSSDEHNCTQCAAEAWLCSDGRCIDLAQRCDHSVDCDDTSDEINCTACPPEAWRCLSGQCVYERQRCDGEVNCKDKSDETSCTSCNMEAMTCNDGQCIPFLSRCNGKVECRDKSDEENCSSCSITAWPCNNGQCISLSELCDGQEQCLDKSDESHCTRCSDTAWRCKTGQCVPIGKRCNNVYDCQDQSDEISCAINVCGLIKSDIVFVVEDPVIGEVKDFVQDFLQIVDANTRNVRAGAVTYKTVNPRRFPLRDFSKQKDIFDDLDREFYLSLEMNKMVDALKETRAMFTNASDVVKVAVLVAYSSFNTEAEKVLKEAKLAKDALIHIYTVDVGSANSKLLQDLASEPREKNSFSVPSVSSLKGLAPSVVSNLCERKQVTPNGTDSATTQSVHSVKETSSLNIATITLSVLLAAIFIGGLLVWACKHKRVSHKESMKVISENSRLSFDAPEEHYQEIDHYHFLHYNHELVGGDTELKQLDAPVEYYPLAHANDDVNKCAQDEKYDTIGDDVNEIDPRTRWSTPVVRGTNQVLVTRKQEGNVYDNLNKTDKTAGQTNKQAKRSLPNHYT
ncbi:very low-density lipoprotein receptor-like isoform X2 [Biomphalaria glabrata]|uniref:Very low-density lipoprotein receptor-like isoform X2 n=1 Tax=Biomphalaria glabrata TaxID=6526 RepID=A0A9W3A9K7_BIOGL|nr:very low-density lipoprotein receptor-like isoform X2 [Biomphalaria glabrata]